MTAHQALALARGEQGRVDPRPPAPAQRGRAAAALQARAAASPASVCCVQREAASFQAIHLTFASLSITRLQVDTVRGDGLNGKESRFLDWRDAALPKTLVDGL